MSRKVPRKARTVPTIAGADGDEGKRNQDAAESRPLVQRGPIPRRGFIRTTGSAIVAVVGAACVKDTTRPEDKGVVTVTLVGLDISAASGGHTKVFVEGSAVAIAEFDLPAENGEESSELLIGHYVVDYSPPLYHTLAPGQEAFPRTVEIQSGQTTMVDVALVYTAPVGTLQVDVSGLVGTPVSGGTAVAQRTDAGGTPIPINVAGDGTGSAPNVAKGTYAITYTPPGGYSNAAGLNPRTGIVLDEGVVVHVGFTVAVIPAPTGTLVVNVTGLSGTPPSGGTAVAQRTDAAGSPIPITIFGVGSGSVTNVPAGTYTVTYTAPSGYSIPGTTVNPKTGIVVSGGASSQTSFAVQLIPTTGTIQVNVTGLSGTPANGGSAVAQRTDAAGTPINISISVAGSGSATNVPAGTYSITYAAPGGFSIGGAVINPVTGLVVAVGGTATAIFAVVAAGTGFITPNIINNASFETNFDGMCSTSFGTPDSCTRDSTRAFSGTKSIKRVLGVTSSDQGGSLDAPFYAGSPLGSWTPSPAVPATSPDRVWSRFYFYFDAAINGILKFHQFYDSGYNTQFSGLYVNGGQGVQYLATFFTPESDGTGGIARGKIAFLPDLIGAWHSLEMDLWRNGDTSKGGVDYPSVALWLDGNPITSFIGGAPPAPASWINGRLNFGARSSSAKIGAAHWLGVLNGLPANTIPGNVWIDRIAISTLGRIGP